MSTNKETAKKETGQYIGSTELSKGGVSAADATNVRQAEATTQGPSSTLAASRPAENSGVSNSVTIDAVSGSNKGALEGQKVSGESAGVGAKTSTTTTAEAVQGDAGRGLTDRQASLEGVRSYDVYRVGEPGDKITDIDHIERGVLWEEKTARDAINRQTGADETPKWVSKHVTQKFDAYLEAREQLAGYEEAPIGFRFLEPNAEPEFKAAVEKECDRLRNEHPKVSILTHWS